MAPTHTGPPIPGRPLRLWPGVVAAALLCLFWFVIPWIQPDAGFYTFVASMVAALSILVWWLFFSRAPWIERVGVLVLMAVAMFATSFLVDISIRTAMMGRMLSIFGTPVLCLALVAGVVAARHRSAGFRRASIAAAILLVCGGFIVLRSDGVKGSGVEWAWRWAQSSEQRLLARGEEPATLPPPKAVDPPKPSPAPATSDPKSSGKPPAAPAPVSVETERPAQWPGFRGPGRDGIVRGVRIKTDWSASPPVAIWRRPVGPGWSSFAVRGDFLYTQEQRGDEEIVACYKISTGEPAWRHRDPVRFWESNGGAGPRATPTLDKDRVYAFGATGVLNALDAASGKVLWSRNVATDTGRKVPMWGFASSPLVVDDVVIVAAAGTLAGYDVATGDLRWRGPLHGGSYSSPHRAEIGGAIHVLLLGGPGVISVSPANGALLWEHAWEPGSMVQPALTPEGDVLVNGIGTTGGLGTRRLHIAQGPGGWRVEERWTSNGLKPYFNDFVIHKGHAYGFDGSILASIDLQDGQRKWKGGRYGNGQLVLLADQDLLLVVSEEGELALVSATPDKYTELARIPGIEGKTWNHPAVIGNVLLVRNGQEMAAFRMPPAGP